MQNIAFRLNLFGSTLVLGIAPRYERVIILRLRVRFSTPSSVFGWIRPHAVGELAKWFLTILTKEKVVKICVTFLSGSSQVLCTTSSKLSDTMTYIFLKLNSWNGRGWLGKRFGIGMIFPFFDPSMTYRVRSVLDHVTLSFSPLVDGVFCFRWKIPFKTSSVLRVFSEKLP